MKIDDIITEIENKRAGKKPAMMLLDIIRELAEHVKAQEPEPFYEADIMLQAEEDQLFSELAGLVKAEGQGRTEILAKTVKIIQTLMEFVNGAKEQGIRGQDQEPGIRESHTDDTHGVDRAT